MHAHKDVHRHVQTHPYTHLRALTDKRVQTHKRALKRARTTYTCALISTDTHKDAPALICPQKCRLDIRAGTQIYAHTDTRDDTPV